MGLVWPLVQCVRALVLIQSLVYSLPRSVVALANELESIAYTPVPTLTRIYVHARSHVHTHSTHPHVHTPPHTLFQPNPSRALRTSFCKKRSRTRSRKSISRTTSTKSTRRSVRCLVLLPHDTKALALPPVCLILCPSDDSHSLNPKPTPD